MRRPANRIEKHRSEIVILPAFVIVRAGETETTAFSIRPIVSPGHMLAFAIRDHFANRGISASTTIRSLQSFRPGNR